MKKALAVALVVLGFATSTRALDIKAITAKPTADNPRFDNKEAWPDLVGDEYFLKQEWPKTRLLIWAHAPSEEATTTPVRGGPRPDIADPASWIDAATGKPADAIPDMGTDVIFPDADRPYKVTGSGFICRHLTVGQDTDFQPGGGRAAEVFGNVWIRPGGIFYVYRTLMLVGGHNTFFRHDWPEDGNLKELHDTGAIVPFDPADPKKPNPWSWRTDRRPCISHFFQHDKPEGSTEMIGHSSSRDEVGIKAGRLIVGRDSRFLCGGAANLDIHRDAAIVLMDGAVTGKTVNQFGICLRMLGGSLTAGTPDRPIKRDARIGVGYCNWMNLSFPDQTVGRRGNAYDYGRFSANVSGKLIGYPAEGSDARLVFGWQRVSMGGGGRGVNATDGFNRAFAKLQPKITVWVDPEAQVENVRFEDLHRGGIVTPDAAAAKNWKNVTYGEGCLSKTPEKLIREYTGRIDRGRPVEPLTPEKEYTSM